MIFAREITPGLTSLVKKIDAAAVENKSARMGSFVVLMTDDDKMEETLKKMAEKEGLKKVVLTIDNPNGPPKWKIEKNADVTVVLYAKQTVKETMAFEKGKLDDKAIEKVIAGLDTIAPKKDDEKKDEKKGDEKDERGA